jgi:DNA polymerase V
MYALIDCNNFYASCERLFRPDLWRQPIVVLSNNDGCIIARSNEAKQLGLKMGEPYFKIKAFCRQNNVHVFSSNFPLYGDLSSRVMSIIQDHWQSIEIYSIDEAFLDLSTLPSNQHMAFCHHLNQTILKHTGIPTSIGLGATKTLAKLSNYVCKKKLHPVVNIQNHPHWLSRIPIAEVWGIGRQWQQKLLSQGICTAHDLATINLQDYRSQWNVALLRTAMELRGIACFQTSQKPSQSILSSRSFAEMQSDFDILAQAISRHCARAYEKLRAQGLTAKSLSVFIHTNRHRPDLPPYHPMIALDFIHPTDDIRVITAEAKNGLQKIFRPGYYYKKAGVRLDKLAQKNQAHQSDLLDFRTKDVLLKTENLMTVFDRINQKFGHQALKLAAEGHQQSRLSHSKSCSPCYTTRWSDLAIVKNLT